ncbi:acyl-ACP desaturase [bacterium]|nr:acyl-ACP desaturase [bacterium]
MAFSLTKRLAGLAVPYLTLEDAKTRHRKRKPMLSSFDWEQINKDHDAGKITPECRAWLHMMIMTEAGTPVYTELLTSLADSRRKEFQAFFDFVMEVWTPEEAEHGECALQVAKAIGFDIDVSLVRKFAPWRDQYLGACPPCERVLGTVSYTVIQEEITYHSHRAYAELSGSEELARMGKTIAAEERYHSYFYASRLKDVLEVSIKDGMSEETAYKIVGDVIKRFNMPTKYHLEAYRKYVETWMGDLAVDYLETKRNEIRRQLGPIFMACGGWKLVRAIIDAGPPIKYSEGDAAEYKVAAAS